MTQEKLYEEMLGMVHEGMKEIHKTGIEGIQAAGTLDDKLTRCGDYARAMTGMGAMLSTLALMKPYTPMSMMTSNWCAGNGNQ